MKNIAVDLSRDITLAMNRVGQAASATVVMMVSRMEAIGAVICVTGCVSACATITVDDFANISAN